MVRSELAIGLHTIHITGTAISFMACHAVLLTQTAIFFSYQILNGMVQVQNGYIWPYTAICLVLESDKRIDLLQSTMEQGLEA